MSFGIGAITEPIVYRNGADSLMTLPIESITADKMPGIAEGRTTLNIVCSLPAPKPKLPSRRLSGTALRLSSVERTTVGKSIIETVQTPARTLFAADEPPNSGTKVIIPNKP